MMPAGDDDGDKTALAGGDPLDFFGAIRNLVEQSIQPEDLRKYSSQQPLEVPVVNSSSSFGGIVVELQAENDKLRQRVLEFESARPQREQARQLLSEAETALDQSKTELSSVREAAARDLSFQASRAKAEAALARADSEATLAQLGEEFRKFREKTAADEEAGAARLESLRGALATERDQLSALKRAREEDVQRRTVEAAAAAAAADVSLAEARERFRVFREEVSAREEAGAERVRSLRDALAAEREKSSASTTASAAAQRQLEDSLDGVREEFRAFREAASGVSEAKILAVEDDLAAERERFEASEASREQLEAELAAQGKALAEIRDEARLQAVQGDLAREQELREASEASKKQLEADLAKQGAELAKEREDFRVFRENVEGLGQGDDAQLRKVEGDLAAEREQSATLKKTLEASKEQLEADLAKQGADLAKEREDFRAFRANAERLGEGKDVQLRTVEGDLVALREQSSALKKTSEALQEQLEADLAKQGEALAKEREDFRVFRENAEGLGEGKDVQIRKVEGDLAAEREQSAALKKTFEASKEQLEADLAKQGEGFSEEREGFRIIREKAAKVEQESATQLGRIEEELVAEREESEALKKALETSKQELEAYLGKQGEALAKEREDFRVFRENTEGLGEDKDAQLRKVEGDLAAEREQSGAVKKTLEASKEQLEADLAKQGEALAKEREDFRVFRENAEGLAEGKDAQLRKVERDLAVEGEESEALKKTLEASKEQLEADLGKQGEALAKEREDFRVFRENAEGLGGGKDAQLRKVEGDLAAEREESEALKKALEASKEQLEADLAKQGEALVKEREDFRVFRENAASSREALRRAEASLAAERQKFSAAKRASEAKIKLLRAAAGRADDLEDQLSAKSLRLKQKEAEARVLATDGKVVRGLRESLTCKDNALNELRQELGNLRVASAAAEAGGAQAAMATRKQQQQQLYGNVGSSERRSIGMPGSASRRENAGGSDDDGAAVAGGDMTRTFSLSSEEEIDSSGESSGLGAIVEEADSSGTESSAAEEEDSDSEGEEGGGVAGYGGKMSVVQEGDEESESEGGRSSVDGEQEGSDRTVENGELSADDGKDAGAGAARLSLSPLAPRLDYSEDRPSADPPVSATYAAAAAMFDRNEDQKVGVHRGGRSTSARRLSMSLSPPPGARRSRGARASVAPGGGGYRPGGGGDGGGCAKSLSPLPLRGGKKSRASWSPGAGLLPHAAARLAQSPPLSCLSPMVRLAPADHGLGREGNTVVLELGAWRVRAGVVTPSGEEGKSSSYFDDFPCCVARPSREGADLDELVNGASSLAAPMYSKFRDTGVFVGGDAWYCCLDHPSIALRSKLRLSCPMRRRDQPPSREDTERLADHAYGLLKQDSSLSPTLLTYKPTATVDEVLALASVLLEVHRVPAIRMVNEAQLAALAVGVKVGVIVDIGESGVSVTPIFDGFPVPPAVRSECCGGGDVTKFLDYMLLSRTNEHFNQMTDRRRLEYTREMKEEQCYVPLDFALEVEEYGAFKRKAMRVCKGAQASPMLSGYEACDSRDFIDETDKDEEVTKTKTFTLKSGSELDVKIGRERFHAPEILFTPGLWNEGGVSRSLSQAVLDALAELDSDTKADMLDDIVVVGGSARMDGLGDRLEEDLKAMLPEWMSERVDVRVPAADELNHRFVPVMKPFLEKAEKEAAALKTRNRTSRGDPSAVTVGAEMLLEEGAGSNDAGTDGGDWITTAQWAETPEVSIFV
ncbi:TiTiN family member (ttn-1) [Ectocarpus siliculosus]|uniref:TiTiN family member (Ttn-1) n=1 Tax=Ectocarpus siliculosus TaxID=2880 RepID=D7FHM1_ECTSI|nr:TiTiN family member (ttn-1) [Ectocarpus siliculosus]|eukprot:CBJ28578.1 TiTiN family member (ttn-1) [Ectocarpus siliculosus]